MKIIKNKFFICILLLVSGLNSFAQNDCFDDCGNAIPCNTPGAHPIPPGPCDETPINENIIILLFLALLFGIYVIYKFKQNKKTAV